VVWDVMEDILMPLGLTSKKPELLQETYMNKMNIVNHTHLLLVITMLLDNILLAKEPCLLLNVSKNVTLTIKDLNMKTINTLENLFTLSLEMKIKSKPNFSQMDLLLLLSTYTKISLLIKEVFTNIPEVVSP
jgi:hypothetical protein